MSIILWTLAFPAAATSAAIAWAHWSNRPRGPEEAIDSVEEYRRVRSAMADATRLYQHPSR